MSWVHSKSSTRLPEWGTKYGKYLANKSTFIRLIYLNVSYVFKKEDEHELVQLVPFLIFAYKYISDE